MYRLFGKRLIDVAGALVSLILLSPVMMLIAILVKIEDGGPCLFSQNRIGQYGVVFRLYKFRSMATSTRDVPSTQVGALKITRVGKVIRRTNLDELPQLFNILLGSMSIVGPRPALLGQHELNMLRRDNGALDCKPGLTGLAQVSSFDGMPDEVKAEYDGKYSSSISLLQDAHVVLRTFYYLLKPPPIY